MGNKIISAFLFISLFFTRFYMLGYDIVNRDAFHFKNWSYVFMKEFEAGNWNKLFVTIQPGVLTIYSNIIGFKFLYFFKDKLGLISAEGKELELLLHVYQKIPQTILIVFLSILIFYLLKNLFNYCVAILFLSIYIFEPFFMLHSRVIQTDALQAILIFISLLFILTWGQSKQLRYLIISGVFGGLAFIEKSSTIAFVPFVFLILTYFLYRNHKKWNVFVISILKIFAIYIVVFMGTAYVFFPSYWIQPVYTLLRMTLDAYIHGVGGYNLDTYNFVRPNNLGNPIQFNRGFFYLSYIFYNYSLIFLTGIILAIVAIFQDWKIAKPNLKKLLLIVGFGVWFLLIIQIGNQKMLRYLIVSTIPFTLFSAYGHYMMIVKYSKKIMKNKWVIVGFISVIGYINYFYYVPDFGAYSNLVAKVLKKEQVFAGGTGNYKLGKYLQKKYGDNRTVMIDDYTALYLYYPGNVMEYNKDKVKLSDLVIATSSTEEEWLTEMNLQKIDEFVARGNIRFKIFEK